MDYTPNRLGDDIKKDNIPTEAIDNMLVGIDTSPMKTYTEEMDEAIEQLKILQPIEKEVAMAVVNGISFKAIATKLDLDIATVKLIRNRKHVREFISDYLKEITIKEKQNREDLIAQIVEARLNNLDENEDMASLSNKDTLDLIMALDQIQKEREKAELGTKDNQVVNILNLIKKD